MKEGSQPPRHAKIDNLQILRFLAAAAVLISHAADIAMVRDAAFWRVPWTAGVDVFFVISGAIMTILTVDRFGRAGEARGFLVRRIVRIVPLYWLFTLLMIATVLVLPGQVRHSQATPGSVISSLLFVPWTRPDHSVVPILSQGWTLLYEAFFYLAFALALLHRRGLAMLVGGLVLLAAAHVVIPPRLVAPYFWSNPIILEFVAGIGLGRLWLGGLRLGSAARCALAAASVLLFLASGTLGLAPLGRLFANGIPAAALAAAFLFGDEHRSPNPLRWALIASGNASYALYLSHTFVINAVVLAIGTNSGGWPTLAIASVMAIAMSFVVHGLIERPALRLLHRRFD